MDNSTSDISDILSRIKKAFVTRFSLRTDQADDDQIDHNIRSGVELNGTYLWTLMCAILIASIGLNINSAVVVIGAMLISPLMGPIMGIGYGVGIYDFRLIHKALKNLAIATIISFITSAIYFYVTPLNEAQSELLSRTSPNIWDLLIAVFGGLAGIIGLTRKEKSNVIPGVAIATALMPPVCTAAYGFVHGNMSYFLGASYLFLLNCIYIALSSVLVVWFISPEARRKINEKLQFRLKAFLLTVVCVSCIPSVFIAINFVNNQIFNSNVSTFISKELVFDNTFPVDYKSSYKNKTISVVLVGQELNESTVEDIRKSLAKYGLADTKLDLKQVGVHEQDINAIRTALAKDILANNDQEAQKKEQIHETIQAETQSAALKAKEEKQKLYSGIADEVYIQYPDVSELFFADAYISKQSAENKFSEVPTVIVISKKVLKKDIKKKIEKWMKYRFQSQNVQIIFVKR